MKIAIVSKADARGGGASRVAEDLNELLNRSGAAQSVHYVAWSEKPLGARRKGFYADHQKAVSFLHKWSRKAGFYEYVPFEMLSVLRTNLVERHDLFHFHDITTAYSPATLDFISRRKPTVWTFHDCSPFTGGCLHPAPGCERYKADCGDCPMLGTWPLDVARDHTRMLLHQKRRLLRAGRIQCVAPSAWLADKAWESGNVSERPLVIPNPVDTDLFRPRDKRAARERLRIPQDRPVVMFTAGDVASVKKGARTFAEVGRALADLDPYFLFVGRFSAAAAEIHEGLDAKFVGYLNDPREIAKVYDAADLFMNFSVTDNLPLVVLETMACAVPCLAYATGGIPEMIVQDETGVVVPQNDQVAAVRAARELLSGGRLAAMGRAARERAVVEYGTEVFVERHRALYRRLLRNDRESVHAETG